MPTPVITQFQISDFFVIFFPGGSWGGWMLVGHQGSRWAMFARVSVLWTESFARRILCSLPLLPRGSQGKLVSHQLRWWLVSPGGWTSLRKVQGVRTWEFSIHAGPTLTTAAVLHYFHCCAGGMRVMFYLDDLFLAPFWEQALLQTVALVPILSFLGFMINWQKSPPLTVIRESVRENLINTFLS